MRVLLLTDRIPPENMGGAGEVVWRLALGLRDRGHDVHVACANEQRTFQEVRQGIPTYHLYSHYHERWRAYLSLYNPQTVSPLRALMRDLRPDVVNAHNIHADLSYQALTSAAQLGIRTVFTSHDVMPFAYTKLSHFVQAETCNIPPSAYRLPPFYNLRRFRWRYNPLRNLIIRYLLTMHADARIAVSDALATAHHANGLPPFQTVHNGIRVDDFRVTRAEIESLRIDLGLVDRKVILFAGRLSNAKGTQQLLKALQKVAQKVPNVTVLVLSATPLDVQIPQPEWHYLKTHHMTSGGWLSGRALASAFHLADVVVSPSVIFDSFPTVNLEAMACSKPVITTCFGGGKEAVNHCDTGYVINPLQTDAFANVIIKVLIHPEMARQMGERGLQRVQEQFSVDEWVQKTVAVYKG